jgi:hypothetical protein
MTKKKYEALEFDLKVLPPPTVPPTSWADYADYVPAGRIRLFQAIKTE